MQKVQFKYNARIKAADVFINNRIKFTARDSTITDPERCFVIISIFIEIFP